MRDKGKEREREKEEEEEEEEEKEISKLFLEIMEGYSDSVIPPLSEFSPTLTPVIDEKGSNSRKQSRQKAIDHRESIQKERARREKITEMFSLLQSIVPNPNLFPKASRETIVSSTIEYIRRLEEERERMEERKKLLSPAASSSKNPTLCHCTNPNFSVDVAISDGMVFFEIESLVRRYCLVTEIVGVFTRHRAEVLSVNVSVNGEHLKLTVTAVLTGGDGVHMAEKIKTEILLL